MIAFAEARCGVTEMIGPTRYRNEDVVAFVAFVGANDEKMFAIWIIISSRRHQQSVTSLDFV